MNHELWHEVYRFLTLEAEMLDEHRYEDWLELFSEDAYYSSPVPINTRGEKAESDLTGFSVFEGKPFGYFGEDKEGLRQRIRRLRSGSAWAESPQSRTVHSFSNLYLEKVETDDSVRVRCNFTVYQNWRESKEHWFTGSRQDHLRMVDGEWKIQSRSFHLQQPVLQANHISVFF